jgi:hypothetical protein
MARSPGGPVGSSWIGRRRAYVSDLGWFGTAFAVGGAGSQSEVDGDASRLSLGLIAVVGVLMIGWAVKKKLSRPDLGPRWF